MLTGTGLFPSAQAQRFMQAPPVQVPKDAPVITAPGTPGQGMRLDVVVAPKNGKGGPLTGLPENAFTLLVDGKPQTVTAFRAVSGPSSAPFKVVLAIDDVNISYSRLAYEREQIDNYLRGHDGQLANPTALAVVTDTDVQMTGFFTNGIDLDKVLQQKQIGLRDIYRSSGFYGAQDRLDISLKSLSRLTARLAALPGRKALLWISPGWPLLSGPAIELTARQETGIFEQVQGFTNALRRADVTLYAVNPLGAGESPLRTFYYEEFLKAPRKPSQAQLGDLGLQVLAVQSGGAVLNSSNDVASLIARAVADTQAYYEMTFLPPPPDAPGSFHSIEVRVNVPHVEVRTRNGYYTVAAGAGTE